METMIENLKLDGLTEDFLSNLEMWGTRPALALAKAATELYCDNPKDLPMLSSVCGMLHDHLNAFQTTMQRLIAEARKSKAE